MARIADYVIVSDGKGSMRIVGGDIGKEFTFNMPSNQTSTTKDQDHGDGGRGELQVGDITILSQVEVDGRAVAG